MARERLLGIQFARGLAALLVAVYHGSRMVSLPQYAGQTAFGGLLEFGYAGVDFFFVLSGFIIYFVHHQDLGRLQTLPRYAWRRVTRIYPSYWLVLAVAVALAFVRQDPLLTPDHLIRSTLLLPNEQEPILAIAWTLIHEMLFYCIFALGIINFRLGIAAGLIWLLLIVTDAGGLQAPIFRVVSSPLNLLFLMGIIVAKLVLAKAWDSGPWFIAAGLAAFLATGIAENMHYLDWASMTSHLIFGACSAVMIFGIAAAERAGKLRVGRFGEFFGGASYFLYLIHTIVIGFAYRGLAAAGIVQSIPREVSVLIAVACAVATAGILYRFFDFPVQGLLNKIGRATFARRRAE